MFSMGKGHKIMKIEGGRRRGNYLGNNNTTIIGEGPPMLPNKFKFKQAKGFFHNLT